MRIISGEFRGRRLFSPNTSDIRPTSDRVRESLFSIIDSHYPEQLSGAKVIDIFAGTGALGLEAISRGAGSCMFVENSTEGVALIEKNIATLKLENLTKILRSDAARIPSNQIPNKFDMLFADPPYRKNLANNAITNLIANGGLTSGALIIIEESISSPEPDIEACLIEKRRKFGDTVINILKYNP